MTLLDPPAQSPGCVLFIHLSQAHFSRAAYPPESPGSHEKTHPLILWDLKPGGTDPHRWRVVGYVPGLGVSLK